MRQFLVSTIAIVASFALAASDGWAAGKGSALADRDLANIWAGDPATNSGTGNQNTATTDTQNAASIGGTISGGTTNAAHSGDESDSLAGNTFTDTENKTVSNTDSKNESEAEDNGAANSGSGNASTSTTKTTNKTKTKTVTIGEINVAVASDEGLANAGHGNLNAAEAEEGGAAQSGNGIQTVNNNSARAKEGSIANTGGTISGSAASKDQSVSNAGSGPALRTGEGGTNKNIGSGSGNQQAEKITTTTQTITGSLNGANGMNLVNAMQAAVIGANNVANLGPSNNGVCNGNGACFNAGQVATAAGLLSEANASGSFSINSASGNLTQINNSSIAPLAVGVGGRR